jgi:hypothetical protein
MAKVTYEQLQYNKEQLAIQEKKLAEVKKQKVPAEREKYKQIEIGRLEKIVRDFKNKISTIQASLSAQSSPGPGGPKK